MHTFEISLQNGNYKGSLEYSVQSGKESYITSLYQSSNHYNKDPSQQDKNIHIQGKCLAPF